MDCSDGLGIVQGVGSVCYFWHRTWEGPVIVHGGDVSAPGTDDMLDKCEDGLRKSFECTTRDRRGSEPSDLKEIRMLNRILRIAPGGLRYGADPKHAELLAKSMGLDDCKKVGTAATKKAFTRDVTDLPVVDACDGVAALDACLIQLSFDVDNVEVRYAAPYSGVYGCRPSKIVFQRMGSF